MTADHPASPPEFNERFSSLDEANLKKVWDSLVRFAIGRGMTVADAEDLAQETIIAAASSFDPSRGEFEPFCRTILANKAINLHKASGRMKPIPEDGGKFVDQRTGPGWSHYHRQCQEKADRLVADALSTLDKEAAEFFLILADVHADLDYGEVSEAARRAGISPDKGWDIFRRIQRRFKNVDRSVTLPEKRSEHREHDRWALSDIRIPANQHDTPIDSVPMEPPSDIPAFEKKFLWHVRSRYLRFGKNLESASRRQLLSILRR